MAEGLAFDQSNIIILVFETFLYGIFFLLFPVSIWILGRASRNIKLFHKMMMGTVTLMFLIATAHMIVSVMRAFDAYTSSGPGVLYYLDLADKKQTILNSLYVAQTFVGDAFIISRVYMVWDKSLVVILVPICLLFGWLVVAVITLFKFVHSTPEDSFATFRNWVIANYSLTLATCITCTFLISWKIWMSTRRSRQAGISSTRTLMPVIYTIVESAAIYSSAVLSILIVYLLNFENGGYIEILPPLIGVVFSLIVVQVHWHKGRVKHGVSSMPRSRWTNMPSTPGISSNLGQVKSSTPHDPDEHPMSPLSSKRMDSSSLLVEKEEEGQEGSYPHSVY